VACVAFAQFPPDQTGEDLKFIYPPHSLAMAISSRLAAGLAVAASLLIGLALVAPALVDEDALSTQVRDQVREHTQRELQLEHLRLRLLPSPTVLAARLSLANPDWARAPQLLEAEDVSIRLAWLPLLRGQLVVSGLSAHTLALSLETDAQGRNSWDLPQSSYSRFDLRQLRQAEFGTVAIAWRAPGQTANTLQLRSFEAHAKPGARDLVLSSEVLAHGEPMKLSLALSDVSQLGQPGASSQGEARLEFDKAKLALRGQLPLSAGLEKYRLQASLEAESLAAVQRFLGQEGPLPGAVLTMEATLKRQAQVHEIDKLVVKLGGQRLQGEGQLEPAQTRWRLKGKLTGQSLDWAQLMRDLGNAPPRKPDQELLPVHPLAWSALARMQAIDASLDTRFDTLVTRNGLVLSDWRSQILVAKDGITLADTAFGILGGTGKLQLHLRPSQRQAQLHLELQRALLQEWFQRQPQRAGMVGQGPMDLKADVRAVGNSWKQLAANLNGPVSIRVGALTLRSKKARETEAMLVDLLPALSEKSAEQIQISCIASELRFQNGRAQDPQLLGLKSETSKLLLGGAIDLRQQSLDLGGRVRAARGVTLGIATLAGDVRIAGPLLRPEVSVEPVGALARLGAAIATTGLSVLATAAWDAATSDQDPCAVISAVAQRSPDSR
jgi:uncharacterized protein involved in outer membrane biogenesis